MRRDIDVIDVTIVYVNGMEAILRAIDDFQADAFLDGHINQQRLVNQFTERLEGHKLVVWLRCPGIDLAGVP